MSWFDGLGETIGSLGELAEQGVGVYNQVDSLLDQDEPKGSIPTPATPQPTVTPQVVNSGLDTKTMLIAGGVVLGAITLIAVMK